MENNIQDDAKSSLEDDMQSANNIISAGNASIFNFIQSTEKTNQILFDSLTKAFEEINNLKEAIGLNQKDKQSDVIRQLSPEEGNSKSGGELNDLFRGMQQIAESGGQ